eukprot:TRINITY_DN18628_c0_g1_i1.p1 TRINITY_DN18628_c0_g1~~TRINITY_DN18628_c0_g1_i1.p1  ORF type:complete len:841 (+),score=266.19 TRINITY_DN18628_c0_g1_i1:247-2523(+)
MAVVGLPERVRLLLDEDAFSLSSLRFYGVHYTEEYAYRTTPTALAGIASHFPPNVQCLAMLDTPLSDSSFDPSCLGTSPIVLDQADTAPPATHIKQYMVSVKDRSKLSIVSQICATNPQDKIIFLCQSKRTCEQLARNMQLSPSGRGCTVFVHGGLSASIKREAIECFTSGQYPFLVTTDAILEQVRFPHVRLVVGYDLPASSIAHINRTCLLTPFIEGSALITLCSPSERKSGGFVPTNQESYPGLSHARTPLAQTTNTPKPQWKSITARDPPLPQERKKVEVPCPPKKKWTPTKEWGIRPQPQQQQRKKFEIQSPSSKQAWTPSAKWNSSVQLRDAEAERTRTPKMKIPPVPQDSHEGPPPVAELPSRTVSRRLDYSVPKREPKGVRVVIRSSEAEEQREAEHAKQEEAERRAELREAERRAKQKEAERRAEQEDAERLAKQREAERRAEQEEAERRAKQKEAERAAAVETPTGLSEVTPADELADAQEEEPEVEKVEEKEEHEEEAEPEAEEVVEEAQEMQTEEEAAVENINVADPSDEEEVERRPEVKDEQEEEELKHVSTSDESSSTVSEAVRKKEDSSWDSGMEDEDQMGDIPEVSSAGSDEGPSAPAQNKEDPLSCELAIPDLGPYASEEDQMMAEMFRVYDTDGNNFISYEELNQLLKMTTNYDSDAELDKDLYIQLIHDEDDKPGTMLFSFLQSCIEQHEMTVRQVYETWKADVASQPEPEEGQLSRTSSIHPIESMRRLSLKRFSDSY